jgi:hypothetical protein
MTTKSSVCWVKVIDLFFWHPIRVLALGILNFVGKGAAPLIGQLSGEMAGGFFFLLSLVLGAICYKWEPWSSLTRWLACEQYFVPSSHWAGCNWDLSNSLPVCTRWSDLLFLPGRVVDPTAVILSGQLLPPARWGSLVLNTAFSPMRLAQGFTTAPLWEVGLWSHPHSLPLLLVLP